MTAPLKASAAGQHCPLHSACPAAKAGQTAACLCCCPHLPGCCRCRRAPRLQTGQPSHACRLLRAWGWQASCCQGGHRMQQQALHATCPCHQCACQLAARLPPPGLASRPRCCQVQSAAGLLPQPWLHRHGCCRPCCCWAHLLQPLRRAQVCCSGWRAYHSGSQQQHGGVEAHGYHAWRSHSQSQAAAGHHRHHRAAPRWLPQLLLLQEWLLQGYAQQLLPCLVVAP